MLTPPSFLCLLVSEGECSQWAPTRELWAFLCRSGFSNFPLSPPPLLVLLSSFFFPLFSWVLSAEPSGNKRKRMRRGFPFLSDLLLDSSLTSLALGCRSDANLLMQDLTSYFSIFGEPNPYSSELYSLRILFSFCFQRLRFLVESRSPSDFWQDEAA